LKLVKFVCCGLPPSIPSERDFSMGTDIVTPKKNKFRNIRKKNRPVIDFFENFNINLILSRLERGFYLKKKFFLKCQKTNYPRLKKE
jgi:hypothetical protein